MCFVPSKTLSLIAFNIHKWYTTLHYIQYRLKREPLYLHIPGEHILRAYIRAPDDTVYPTECAGSAHYNESGFVLHEIKCCLAHSVSRV